MAAAPVSPVARVATAKIQLRCCAVPDDTFGETNCAFIHPSDGTNIKFVDVNGVIFSVRTDAKIAPGTIALNLMQRNSAGVSNNPGDMLTVDPNYAPPSAGILTLKFELKYFSATKTGGNLSYVATMDAIRTRFSGQYFRMNQVLLFLLGGLKYELRVMEVTAAGKAGAVANVGQLLEGSQVTFVCKESCNIQVTDIPDDVAEKTRAPIIHTFDLQKLGIGGLRAEFGQVFRRAFASRIFPQALVKKLGMKHVKGILLFGPPGTGKTLIARKIGEILNCKPPKIVNGPEIFNKFVGVAEENIRKLFADAEADAPKGDASPLHLIIFDEFDSICKQRGAVRDGTNVSDNVVNQLLSKIDGVNQLNNVLLIGMTNRKDLIDEAILRPGRFEVHVEIGLPDESGRAEILEIHSRGMTQNDLMSHDVDLHALAAQTKNFSGAELEGLVRSAQSFAFSRHIDFDNPTATIDASNIKITMEDFVKALGEVKPAFGASTDDFKTIMRNDIIDFGPEWQAMTRRVFDYITKLRESPRMSSLPILIHGSAGCGKSSLAAHLALKSEFPYVKLLSTDQLVGYGEMQKTNIFRKAFDDAYKSNLSVVILDDIERLVEYSALGARYSNVLLQALLVLIKRPPPEGKKLIVIATCQSIETMDLLECRHSFIVDVPMPDLGVTALEPLVRGWKAEWKSPRDLSRCRDLLADQTFPMKKFLFYIEMATVEEDGRRVISYDTLSDAIASAAAS